MEDRDEAEVVLVNGCTVTARAQRDSRAACYRARRGRLDPWVVLFGCVVRAGHGEGSWRDARTLAVASPEELWPLLETLSPEPSGPSRPQAALALGGPRRGDSRYFLKIQEGCDRGCTYCVVPQARGKPRSVPLEQVLVEARRAAQAGFTDVVLTGTHGALWGRDLVPASSFAALLTGLAAEALPLRYRLGSLEPLEDDQDEVLAALAPGGSLCPHLHIPLQSGSQTILEAMGRPWGRQRFSALCARARHLCGPGLTFGTDLIVGFPGETEALFQETLDFLEASELVFIHTFAFSAREGTKAAAFPGRVPAREVARRSALVRQLAARKLSALQHSLVGQVLEVSVDAEGPPAAGLSDNFLRCRLEAPGPLQRARWVQARVTGVQNGDLVAQVLLGGERG